MELLFGGGKCNKLIDLSWDLNNWISSLMRENSRLIINLDTGWLAFPPSNRTAARIARLPGVFMGFTIISQFEKPKILTKSSIAFWAINTSPPAPIV